MSLAACATTQPYQTDRSVTALEYSPDGRYLALGNAEEIRVLESDSGKLLATLRELPAETKDADPRLFRHGVGGTLVFLDNTRILTTGMGGMVTVWDARDGSLLAEVDPLPGEEFASTLDYSPEANRLVIGTSEGQVMLADLNGDAVRNLSPLTRLDGYVLDLQLSRNGRYFASAYLAPRKTQFVESHDAAEQAASNANSDEMGPKTGDGHEWRSNVQIWDAEQQESLGDLEGATGVFRMELVPGEPSLLTTGDRVQVWEFLTRQPAERISDPNMALQAIGLGAMVVVSVATLSLGGLAPINFADAAFNAATMIPAAPFIRHVCMRSVAISPDGRTIVSTTWGPNHNVMAVIDRSANEVVEKWTADIAVCDMQFSPDGNFLVTATSKGAFRYDTTKWKKQNLKSLDNSSKR